LNVRPWIAALAVACVAPSVHAETLYVIEQLVVSVNAAPDGSGERIAQIKSGDRVELLGRQDDQAQVRLPSGQEGWVKASYLSGSLPLQQQLNARSEELERARKEKTQLEADLAAARRAASAANATSTAIAAAPSQAPAAMVREAAAPEAPAAPAAGMTESISQSAPPLFAANPLMPARPSWLWALGSSLIALVVGFALGWRVLDRRIRAKYGGLRIY
jgi:hypothetical protein